MKNLFTVLLILSVMSVMAQSDMPLPYSPNFVCLDKL